LQQDSAEDTTAIMMQKPVTHTIIIVAHTDVEHLAHIMPLNRTALHTAPTKCPSSRLQPLLASVPFLTIHNNVCTAVCASAWQIAGVHSHSVLGSIRGFQHAVLCWH